MSVEKLKVPHVLEASKCEKIAAILNPLVADVFALYVKTKNYHWHLTGINFRDYHLLFDEQAAQIFEMIDVMAERVRKLGKPTLTSIGSIAKHKQIVDDDELGISIEEMLKRLLKDNLHLSQLMQKAHHVASEAGDFATTSILEVFMDETERRVWFLQSSVAK
jgi:starvation-inducible DNA-binding protein